ncbi:MAG: NAD(P)-dependent oxidoreductase [Terracidiphilus sp.]
MSLLPIFLKLEGRQCLLVGAGNVALEKIGSLLKTGLRLRVGCARGAGGGEGTRGRRKNRVGAAGV